MKNASRYRLVLVAAPDRKTALRVARTSLKARLVACANLVPRIESHYWWQGKIESSTEVLLILKTTSRHLAQLEKLVLGIHPYETPEFLVAPLITGNARYLDWIESSCGGLQNKSLQKPRTHVAEVE